MGEKIEGSSNGGEPKPQPGTPEYRTEPITDEVKDRMELAFYLRHLNRMGPRDEGRHTDPAYEPPEIRHRLEQQQRRLNNHVSMHRPLDDEVFGLGEPGIDSGNSSGPLDR